MKILGLGIIAAATCVSVWATADVVAVVDISDIGTFEGQDNLGVLNVNIRHYSDTIADGGGQFAIGTDDARTSCQPDHGVVLRDKNGTGNCYYRQFSGPVHLSWYGVQDVADPLNNPTCFTYSMPGSCDATTAVSSAFLASAKYGDGGVTTDGRSIAILSHCGGCIETDSGIAIPEGQYLTCGGPPGARRHWAADDDDKNVFSAAPASIVLGDGLTVTRKKNTHFWGCFLRPSWLYTDNHDHGLVLPPTSVGELVQMTHAYVGTATKCLNDGCDMDHMLIAGFDICDDSSNANLAVLSDLILDCPTGEWMHGGGGAGPKLHNIASDAVLEGSLDPHIQSLCYPIVGLMHGGVSADDVVVRVETNYTASAGCDSGPEHESAGYQLQSSGDTVLIAGLGLTAPSGSPVSANGRWLTDSVTQVSSSSQYDVTLTGASWAGPTASGSWKAGASVITVPDNTNIIPGQYICATGTPPLCTPPSDFGFSPTMLSTGITADPNIVAQVLSTAHWPVNGLAKIELRVHAVHRARCHTHSFDRPRAAWHDGRDAHSPGGGDRGGASRSFGPAAGRGGRTDCAWYLLRSGHCLGTGAKRRLRQCHLRERHDAVALVRSRQQLRPLISGPELSRMDGEQWSRQQAVRPCHRRHHRKQLDALADAERQYLETPARHAGRRSDVGT